MAYDVDALAKEWTSKIEQGLKYKEKYSEIKKWGTYRDMYRGNFGNDSKMDKVVVNRIFSYIKSMIPKVYFRSPAVCIAPRRPELAAHARVIESIDNWLIQETNLKYVIKRAILDAGLCGIGPIKLGYDSEYGYFPELGIDQDGASVTQVGVKDGERIEYNSAIAAGMPWAARVRPDEIVTPWGYSDPKDLPWIAHMIIRPVEDIKADQKYDKKLRNQIKGGYHCSNLQGQTTSMSIMGQGDKENYALMYEIRDFKRRKFIVMCEDKILVDTEDSMQIDGLPFEFIVFNEDPEHFWPISDVKMLMPQQNELNEIRQYASKQRKLNIVKFLYSKGSMTKENLDLLLADDIDSIGCGIEVVADAIQNVVFPLHPTNLTSDLIREQQQTEQDMRDTMGYSANQAGNYVDKTNSTATEANIVQEASNIRSDERRDLVADVLSNILRKFNQMIFTYWTTPRVVEITGNDGMQYWIEYTGAQLKGEYNMVISPENGQPVSRALRQQMAENVFAKFNKDPLIDQIGLRRLYLQQTDLIDPSWQNLIRPPMMPPGVPGSEGNPMDFDQAAQDPNVLGGAPEGQPSAGP